LEDCIIAWHHVPDALFEKVAVIWCQTSEDMDATALFNQFHIGTIPQADAELVKALLRSRIKVEHGQRAAEVASQWDLIDAPPLAVRIHLWQLAGDCRSSLVLSRLAT
jgi:hypothetical protein